MKPNYTALLSTDERQAQLVLHAAEYAELRQVTDYDREAVDVRRTLVDRWRRADGCGIDPSCAVPVKPGMVYELGNRAMQAYNERWRIGMLLCRMLSLRERYRQC